MVSASRGTAPLCRRNRITDSLPQANSPRRDRVLMKRILIAEIMAPTHFGLFFVTSSLKGPCMDSRVDLDARIAACKALADSGMPRSEHAAVLFLLGKDYREK